MNSNAYEPSHKPILDFIGIGFGPSNLALAVAARELDPARTGLFLEKNSKFQWHPGMMLDGARMQISFLKDLVTLRNPASPYTFLQFAKAQGRLERFVNLKEFHPARLEYQQYLCWVADQFDGQVRYGTDVKKISPVQRPGESKPSLFRVEAVDQATQDKLVFFGRNLVYATGGKPRVPEGQVRLTKRVIHTSQFLPSFPAQFPDSTQTYEFVVAGDGQSAGEVVAYLLNRYVQARVHLVISGFAPRATDNSPFVNEQFYSSNAQGFYNCNLEKRSAMRAQLRNTNYGVIESELIQQIYRIAYLDEVKGQQRLFIHPFSRLARAEEDDAGIHAFIHDRFSEAVLSTRCDGLVLATGYDRTLDSEIFADILPLVENDELHQPFLSRSYRVRTKTEMACGLYLQGYGESFFGLGDTLLSLLPFRAKEIFDDIRKHLPRVAELPPAPSLRLAHVEYPPKRHLETDPEKLYAVMERFSFATLISSSGTDQPVVTQVPLTIDRSRGSKGVLFGHMDRANPHVDLLEGREVLALFHGPNAYISPHVYKTDQLPTWNSITVHVRGRVRLISDRNKLAESLSGICRQADDRPGAYRLNTEDPRIERLSDFIVGFEIEIEEMIGRFKLSQDRSDCDRRRAFLEMARQSEPGAQKFLEIAFDLDPVLEDAHK